MEKRALKRKFYTLANRCSQYKIHSSAVKIAGRCFERVKKAYRASALGKIMSDHTSTIENSVAYKIIDTMFKGVDYGLKSIGHFWEHNKNYSLFHKLIKMVSSPLGKKIISIIMMLLSTIAYLTYINIYSMTPEITFTFVSALIMILALGVNPAGLRETYESSVLHERMSYFWSSDGKTVEFPWIMSFLILSIPILPKSITMVLLIALSSIKLVWGAVKRKAPLKIDCLIFAIVLFYVVMVIGTGTSTYRMDSIRDLAIHTVAIVWTISMIIDSKNLEKLYSMMVSFVYVATLVAVYGVLQYFIGVEMDAAWVDVQNNPNLSVRVYSVFGNPNILGEYLIMALPISMGLFMNSKGWFKKMLFLGTTGAMGCALVLTFGRGAWLGFAFAVAVMVILYKKELIWALIPAGIVSLFLLPESILNRILSIANLGDSSNAYRIRVWKVAMEMIKDNWILGVGFGYMPFKINYLNYIRTMNVYHSHNMILEIFAELGIGGLLVLVFMLGIILKKLYQISIQREDRFARIIAISLFGSFVAILTNGLTENVLYLPKIIWTFWMIVGFAGILIRVQRTEYKVKEKSND
jgi:O-antigen ligase